MHDEAMYLNRAAFHRQGEIPVLRITEEDTGMSHLSAVAE